MKTKKQYEEYINELAENNPEIIENDGRTRAKKYGTWLRKNDPIAFQVGYREYCEK